MESIIQEIGTLIGDKFREELGKLCTEVRDISEFIVAMKSTLDRAGTMLVAEALESINKSIKASRERKRHWEVKNKADAKTLVTLFGEVSYSRTYYQNKRTGEHKYLSDEAVGILPHERMDTSLKAKLIEEAIEVPYRKSAETAAEAVQLTSQTVMNSIRELGSVSSKAVGIKGGKKAVKNLYIEADEDHVALQDGSCLEPKLVYVHEGKIATSKDRWRLLNPRYFSGVYSNSDELWAEVADYVHEAYEAEAIEKIYLSGDGANWIKNGLGWFKNIDFVLDRYHLSKYVIQATAHLENIAPVMWRHINYGDKPRLEELFRAIIIATESESKKKSVQEALVYILKHWQGIRNQYEPDYPGCSAEGHVSHRLSARLSSRPLAWSKIGLDQMSRLRAFSANGGVVYDLLLAKKLKVTKEVRRKQMDWAIKIKRKLAPPYETFGNLEILNQGHKTMTSRFLRSIRTS